MSLSSLASKASGLAGRARALNPMGGAGSSKTVVVTQEESTQRFDEGACSGAADAPAADALTADESASRRGALARAASGASKLASVARQSDRWGLDVGPLSISSEGMQLKPQCLLGAKVGNFITSAGVEDVRGGQGLKLAATAEVAQDLSATGDSLKDFLKNVKATGGIADDVINPVIAKADDIVVLVLDRVGVNIGGKCRVAGRVKVKVGVGLGAAVSLGWTDNEGYRMVGAGGQAACALDLSFAVFAGLKSPKTPNDVKLIIEASHFSIEAKIARPGTQKPAAAKAPPADCLGEGQDGGTFAGKAAESDMPLIDGALPIGGLTPDEIAALRTVRAAAAAEATEEPAAPRLVVPVEL